MEVKLSFETSVGKELLEKFGIVNIGMDFKCEYEKLTRGDEEVVVFTILFNMNGNRFKGTKTVNSKGIEYGLLRSTTVQGEVK